MHDPARFCEDSDRRLDTTIGHVRFPNDSIASVCNDADLQGAVAKEAVRLWLEAA